MKFLLFFIGCFICVRCSQRSQDDRTFLAHSLDSIYTDFPKTVSDTSKLERTADSIYQIKDYNQAIVEYTKLINLYSGNGKYYFRRAHSLCQVSRQKEAIDDYLKAANLNYKEFDAYYGMGLIYMISYENDSLAKIYLRKALEIKPDSEDVKAFLDELCVEIV